MTDNSGKILKSINPVKIVLPIFIGLGVTGFLMYREYEPGTFSLLNFTLQSLFWLFVAFIFMAIRDLGYMVRLRLLTNKKLSWRKTFNIIMLWEFTSAITPSAIGGTSVAIFFINKEGVRLGRSTAVVMVTSFLDELYFILTFPIILLIMGQADIFALDSELGYVPWYRNQYLLFALTGYVLKFLYTAIITYGLFFNPRGLKLALLWIFKFPVIRKWRPQANESGSDLIETSREFRDWPFKKWVQAFIATFFSWTARYWVVNALVLTFFGVTWMGWGEHFLMFGKQLVMWIMMLVSPTPGGSGFAEYVFQGFLAPFIPVGTGVAMAFIWRLVSYYPYLFIGAFVIPRWVKKHFVSRKH
ncbi:lysylphosphatidylglycerol synthase transmembrane domain-containing protein [Marinilabiliaceae bacterium ANBcel2]|nr:lysylphosphatidylglycerol synthase transmembrane domain-containing protein [Marinilabiliaceae bacterium ANBcel2]